MWSKGAVVIIKHGDEEIANGIESGISLKQPKPLNECKTELAAEARKADIAAKILKAEIDYGYNPDPPKWARKIVGVFALIIYGITLFIDKYLKIKD